MSTGTETFRVPERLQVWAGGLRAFFFREFGELDLEPFTPRNTVLAGLACGTACAWYRSFLPAVLLTLIFFWWNRSCRPLVRYLFMAALVLGAVRTEHARKDPPVIEAADARLLVRADALPRRFSDVWWIEATVLEIHYAENSARPLLPGSRVRIDYREPWAGTAHAPPRHWVRGDRMEFTGKVQPLRPRLNPGTFDRDEYLLNEGFSARFDATELSGYTPGPELVSRLDRFRLDAGEILSGPGRGGRLMSALVLGLRDSVDSEITQTMNRIGLAHLLSISGVHFTLFALWLIVLIETVAGRFPALVLRYPLRRISVVAAIPVLALYTIMTGTQIGTVRALIMFVIAALALATGRRSVMIDGLLLAGAAMLLHDPSLAGDISFQLSCLSMLGIACIPGQLDLPVTPRSLPAVVAGSAAISLAATLVTAPVTAGLFHEVALAGLLANSLLLPLIEGFFLPAGLLGALAVAAGSTRLDRIFAGMWDPLMQSLDGLLLAAGEWLPGPVKTGAPSAAMCIVYFALMGLAAASFRSGRFRAPLLTAAAALLLLVGTGRIPDAGERLIVLDSGYRANVIWLRPGHEPLWMYGGSAPPFKSSIRLVDETLAHRGRFGPVEVHAPLLTEPLAAFTHRGRSFHPAGPEDTGALRLRSGENEASAWETPAGAVVIDPAGARWKSGSARVLGPVAAWVCLKSGCRPPREVTQSSAVVVNAAAGKSTGRTALDTRTHGQIVLDLSGPYPRTSAARPM